MTRRTNRSAATLIELLVVIGILVVLMGLAAMILPSLRTSNNAAKAASIISGQLSIAKQRALRDQAARGIRLVRDTVNDPTGLTVREIQFIEQPPDVVPSEAGVSITFSVTGGVLNVDLPVGWLRTWDAYGVGIGDTLILKVDPGIGDYFNYYAYRIQNLSNLQLQVVPLSMAAPTSGTFTEDFRIVRKPQPLVGEPNIQLSPQMVVDLSKSIPVPGTVWNSMSDPIEIDILFQPGGELASCPVGKVILFVRHEDLGNDSEPTLVCIYAATGNIILHQISPPVPPHNDVYEYTRDGKGSGF